MFSDPAFISAKCSLAIPLSGAIDVDALIGATLDPAVTSIEYLASIDVLGLELPLNAVVITRADGRFLLSIIDDSEVHDLEEVGIQLLALEQHGIGCVDITRAELRTEPGRGDRRRVWASRGIDVSETAKRSVVAAFQDRDEIPIGELAELIATPTAVEALFALACRNLVSLDFTAPLSLGTIVRLVRAPSNKELSIPMTGGRI